MNDELIRKLAESIIKGYMVDKPNYEELAAFGRTLADFVLVNVPKKRVFEVG